MRTSQNGRNEEGEERAEVDGEVEEVEEAAARLLVACAAPELFGAERVHARLDAARAERYQQQACDRAAAKERRGPIGSRDADSLAQWSTDYLRDCRRDRRRCEHHVADRVDQRERHDRPAQ